MNQPALQFDDSHRMGRVAAVDTSKVVVDVENPDLVTRVSVGNLVAVRGATEREFLIGITERITRTLQEEMLDEHADEKETLELGPHPEDVVRVMLVGTYRTVEGETPNTFKRGADSSPQIDRECFLIDGANLQRFMGLLGAGLKEEERLKLGQFVIDPNAVAIASGDRFFQRHASILGSTGSGKSWAVAVVLERASNLKFPNLIVLDMHGEYQPLADSRNGLADGYRIAGPGDLDVPGESVIFLPYWLLNRDEITSMIVDRSDREAPNQVS